MTGTSLFMTMLFCGALALQLVQYYLAHAHALGSNLYVLIVLDILQSLLK